jgi:hypothetical protein
VEGIRRQGDHDCQSEDGAARVPGLEVRGQREKKKSKREHWGDDRRQDSERDQHKDAEHPRLLPTRWANNVVLARERLEMLQLARGNAGPISAS